MVMKFEKKLEPKNNLKFHWLHDLSFLSYLMARKSFHAKISGQTENAILYNTYRKLASTNMCY